MGRYAFDFEAGGNFEFREGNGLDRDEPIEQASHHRRNEAATQQLV
jgi:hypothetical protein